MDHSFLRECCFTFSCELTVSERQIEVKNLFFFLISLTWMIKLLGPVARCAQRLQDEYAGCILCLCLAPVFVVAVESLIILLCFEAYCFF